MSLHGGVKEKKETRDDIGDVKKTQEANPPSPEIGVRRPPKWCPLFGPPFGAISSLVSKDIHETGWSEARFLDTGINAERDYKSSAGGGLVPLQRCLHGGACMDVGTDMYAWSWLHGGVCTKGSARRSLHGRACAAVPARRDLHGEVSTAVPARRGLHGGACTEGSAWRGLHGGACTEVVLQWRDSQVHG